MIYYKLVKVTIDISSLTKIIINMIICYHGIPKSIVTNYSKLAIYIKILVLTVLFFRDQKKTIYNFFIDK